MADWRWKKRLTVQAKWGWTHYRDRNLISSGTEEIQGNDKDDLPLPVRLKWGETMDDYKSDYLCVPFVVKKTGFRCCFPDTS